MALSSTSNEIRGKPDPRNSQRCSTRKMQLGHELPVECDLHLNPRYIYRPCRDLAHLGLCPNLVEEPVPASWCRDHQNSTIRLAHRQKCGDSLVRQEASLLDDDRIAREAARLIGRRDAKDASAVVRFQLDQVCPHDFRWCGIGVTEGRTTTKQFTALPFRWRGDQNLLAACQVIPGETSDRGRFAELSNTAQR